MTNPAHKGILFWPQELKFHLCISFLFLSESSIHLHELHLLETLPGAKFLLAGNAIVSVTEARICNKPCYVGWPRASQQLSAWHTSPPHASEMVRSLPFQPQATSFSAQHELSQGGQHNVLSPVSRFILFLFMLKCQTKKKHSDGGVLSSLYMRKHQWRATREQEISMAVHLPQLTLQNSLSKNNKL